MRVFLVASLLVTSLGASTARAEDTPLLDLHVHGGSKVQAAAYRTADGFLLRGELQDDAGVALPDTRLDVELVGASGPARATSLIACDLRNHDRVTADAASIQTDARGTFCARGKADVRVTGVRLRFAGDPLHDGTGREVKVEEGSPSAHRARLRFEPPPGRVRLDSGSDALFSAWLSVERNDTAPADEPLPSSASLPVELLDERGAVITRGVTSGNGRLRFEVDPGLLGSPGAGELQLRFAGDATLTTATAEAPLEKIASAHLAIDGAVGVASHDGHASLAVTITSPHGVVADGLVEALEGEVSVGAAPVEQGRARLPVALRSTRADRATITLRYVPASPWWRAGEPLTLSLPVAPPSRAAAIILGVLVLALGAWVVAGWRRSPKRARAADRAPIAGSPLGEAGIRVVAAAGAEGGWTGVVRDAHDGFPVARATIRVIVPSFKDDTPIAEAVTDDDGRFHLDDARIPAASRASARIAFEAEEHSLFERALPAPGSLEVALITRRRALVDRLVAWARRQGAPFDAPTEPTPGHVGRAALRARSDQVQAWAVRVEKAAFSQQKVDAIVEREVLASEPNPRERERPLT